ncbi:hypothetical protein [Roseiconus lacunae]|uniref:YHS domain-containing protein n=1 Tax=Roseiconus lacunae TaxID=2605694 RepID=A0ABT7PHG1_9BACT|nr:hypothetical protein [Roseiconus lacunae]MDM4015925.1 hypothetical protein [Roseiconus lacunae]
MRALNLFFCLSIGTLFAGCDSATPPTGDTSESPAITTVSTANTNCPIMGGKVSTDGGTVQWNGKTIGFCCDGCDEKWEVLTDQEKQQKLDEAETESAGESENTPTDSH